MGKVLKKDLGLVIGEVNPETLIPYESPEDYTEPMSGDSVASFMGKVTTDLRVHDNLINRPDKFSEEASYIAGDYCINENVMYKFTGKKDPGAWDPAKAEATNINAELADLYKKFGELNENLRNISIPAAVAVKGNAETEYRTGNVNLTPADIGLGNVNNVADSQKSVNYANYAGGVAWENVDGRPSIPSLVTTVNTETRQITIGASTILSIDLAFSVPSGYVPLGIIAVNANTASCAITRFNLNGTGMARIEIRNITSGNQTVTISAVILCKNNG